MRTMIIAAALLAVGCGNSTPLAPTTTVTPTTTVQDITYTINVPSLGLTQQLLTAYPDGVYLSPIAAQAAYNYSDAYQGTPNVYAGEVWRSEYYLTGIVIAPIAVASLPHFPASMWPDNFGLYPTGVEYRWLGRFAYTLTCADYYRDAANEKCAAK